MASATATRPRRGIQNVSYKEETDSDASNSIYDDSSDDEDESVKNARKQEGDEQIEDDNVVGEVIPLLTAEEVEDVKTDIIATAAELAKANAEYEDIKAKCSALSNKLLVQRARIARVRAIPQELLSLVFLFYTEESSQSPWTLAHICKSWRFAAFGTRQIWTRITLCSPSWKWDDNPRWGEGGEQCSSKKELTRALRRAGTSPLDLTVDLNNARAAGYGRIYDREAFSDMASHMRDTQIKIHHLKIKGSAIGSSQWWTFDLSHLRTLHASSTTQLHSYAAKVPNSTSLRHAYFYLHRYIGDFSRHHLRGVQAYTSLPSLTSLHLDGSCLYRIYNDASEELRVALSSPHCRLHTLKLQTLRLNFAPGTHLQMLKLEELTLDNTSIWPLDAPLLSRLVTKNGSTFKQEAGYNVFPSLVFASFPARDLERDIFWHAKLDQLHTIEVTGPGIWWKSSNHWKNLAPTNLRFQGVYFPSTAQRFILDRFVFLVGLELDNVKLPKNFFGDLAPRREKGSKDVIVPVPLLVSLKVDLSLVSSQTSDKKLVRAGRKTLEARATAGIKMQRAQIRISTDEGWQDLLQ